MAATGLPAAVFRRLTMVFLLVGGGSVHAQEPVSAAARAEIQLVITAQIEAFRRDDGAAAFGFAAPGIQRKFGDGAHFLSAVRQAYAPMYRPRSFSFGSVESGDGLTMQKVEIVGPDGIPALALYSMEHEADGSWRISGCSLAGSELQET